MGFSFSHYLALIHLWPDTSAIGLIKKAEPPSFKAARLSHKTRCFPSPPHDGFGFNSLSAEYFILINTEKYGRLSR